MMAASNLFKKLKLIDEQDIQRLVEKHIRQYDPSLRTLGNLHRDMDSVINRDDISPEEKIALFKSTLARFTNLKSPVASVEAHPFIPASDEDQPPTAPSLANLPPPPRHPLPIRVKLPKDTLDARAAAALPHVDPTGDAKIAKTVVPAHAQFMPDLPDRFATKYARLKDLITKSPDIITHEPRTGELIVARKVIPQSSFHDLISNLYLQNKQHNLLGQPEFLEALSELIKSEGGENQDPKSFISRKSHLRLMTGEKTQKGQGRVSHPPGKAIKVLYLY